MELPRDRVTLAHFRTEVGRGTFPGLAEEQEEDLNLVRGLTPKLLDRVNKVIFHSCSLSLTLEFLPLFMLMLLLDVILILLLILLVKVCKLLEVKTANFRCTYIIDLNHLTANNTPTMDWDR